MKNEKIAYEVAESDFNRFITLMDIDITATDEEDKESLNGHKKKIVSAIQSGAIVIDDNGEPTFTPQRTNDADPITFYEPTGATLQAMDKKQKLEDIGKMYASMGDMTKTNAKTFSRMKMSDLKICLAIATLFLA